MHSLWYLKDYYKSTLGIYNVCSNNDSFFGITIKGKISFTELLGDDSLVELNIGSDTIKVTNIDPHFELSIEKDVTTSIPYSKIHYFATEIGKKLMHKTINIKKRRNSSTVDIYILYWTIINTHYAIWWYDLLSPKPNLGTKI